MALVFIGIGTNLGNKEENIHRAVKNIEEQIGDVCLQSAFYVTEPWGFTSTNTFLNAVAAVRTDFPCLKLLTTLQEIEQSMGRTSKSADAVYKDRIIDLDILLYDDLVYESPVLVIPHPLMTQRLFVMQPLAEIAPDKMHPTKHQTMKELLSELIEEQQ
jgi:2-amino-4-hydroxy-6-hydroxymethyldihydropteridine diphosphokinase